jgi:small-conductance mechanosensitive channel
LLWNYWFRLGGDEIAIFGVRMSTLHDPATLPGALLYGALLLVTAILAARGIRLFVARLVTHGDNVWVDRTGIVFFSELGQALAYLRALAVYAYVVPPLHHLGTALLAGVSVASVVLGVAAQSTLGNLIAGFALLLYRPIRVGDRVQVTSPSGPVVGTIEALNLGYTFIRAADGARLIVPNSTMASQVTVNLNEVPLA